MPKPVDVTFPSDREIRVTRVLDAPRTMVWDCHTRPELLKRWLLGPDSWSMPVCEVDLRVGGRYRYLWRNDETGREFGSGGEHREIVPPERLVTSEKMDGFDGEAVNTMTLTESGGGTTLVITMLYPTTEVRDAARKSGMTDGMAAGYDRLEALAAAPAA